MIVEQPEVENRNYETGTASDFSGWEINNRFGKMKVMSKEKVIEPVEETEEKNTIEDVKVEETSKRKNPIEDVKIESSIKKNPIEEVQSFNINVKKFGEIKELAKTLLPKVDEVKPGDFELACNLAIDFAMTFEGFWNQYIGEHNV